MKVSHEPSVRDRLASIECDVMNGLTPFQRATVEHISGLYANGQRRVLVADEVGLGKTLIARGVISKMARLRESEGDDLVKVAYVCSNASIAAQNISKLAIDGEVQLASADSSRLSMQHLKIARERGDDELKARYIQITPLTPGTSFSINSGAGTMHERALILAVLAYDNRFGKKSGRYERLSCFMWDKRRGSSPGSWNWWCWRAAEDVRLARAGDPERKERAGYPYDVLGRVDGELEESDGITLTSLCDYLDSGDCNRRYERRAINDLRRAFAKVCVDMLCPDFVIMDEFQRFHNLISEDDTETSMLAKRFLGGETRVLLLSATPFRMYSTDAELDSGGFGDSYHEFLEVMDFLGEGSAEAGEKFRKIWGDYTLSLRSLGSGSCDVVTIRPLKNEAETLARSYIARTERQSTGELGPIVDNSTHVTQVHVSPEDIKAFVRMRSLMREAGIRRGLMSADFIKSCPYPLSFMSGYKLFRELETRTAKRPGLVSANKRADGGLLWLRKWDVTYYERLRVHNARYQALLSDIAGEESVHAERLLWVPASRPYYRPSAVSPYSNTQGFSKMILFSSWAMVPPSLSCLLSYEYERRNVLKLRRATGKEYRYFKDEEDRGDEASDSQALPYRRIRFDREQRNAFLLVYPSRYLAGLIDVCELASSEITLAELRRTLRRRIADVLPEALGVEKLPKGIDGRRASVDWYVMAALRLDSLAGFDVMEELLGEEAGRGLRLDSRYKSEAAVLRQIAEEANDWSPREAGRFPVDLVDMLVDAAIASPAVCALRTYGAYAERVPAWVAFQLGHAFVKRMNTSSATLTVAAAMEHKDEASSHWKSLLDYSCEGNLQAVLDEYAYLQRPVGVSLDGFETVLRIHKSMVGQEDEPDFRNVEAVHGVRIPTSAGTKKRIDSMRMRTNIAAAFMDAKSRSTSDAVVSRSNLREAFNSPFRPFVLVSTSVGQEGLDFHRYCRKVCHWNLPSNPIDLEQREGRVNRYQGLSVRQSIASRYGNMEFGKGPIWQQMFETAEEGELSRESGGSHSGLLPFWGVAKGDALVPVERYAYLYPFSKDVAQYDSLIERVYRYRMVIGQPDQEETLRLLRERVEDGTLSKDDFDTLYINLCPFVKAGHGADGCA